MALSPLTLIPLVVFMLFLIYISQTFYRLQRNMDALQTSQQRTLALIKDIKRQLGAQHSDSSSGLPCISSLPKVGAREGRKSNSDTHGFDVIQTLAAPSTARRSSEEPSLPKKERHRSHDEGAKFIGVVTLNAQHGTGGQGLSTKSNWMYPWSYHNKVEYCKKWNYDLIIEDHDVVDGTRDVAWSKIPIFKKWLPKYQWIMWMDMDAFFMRFDMDLEHLLSSDHDVIIAKDFNGINMGVFFIRNSAYTFELLDRMWNTPRKHWIPWEEQSALSSLLDPRYNKNAAADLKHFKFPPQRDFNSYPGPFAYGHINSKYQKGDFIAHFPNCKAFSNCKATIEELYQASLINNRIDPLFTTEPIPGKLVPMGHDTAS